MAPEDLRDDVIENAPTTHTEECSGEEKTWMWYVCLLGLLCLHGVGEEYGVRGKSSLSDKPRAFDGVFVSDSGQVA